MTTLMVATQNTDDLRQSVLNNRSIIVHFHFFKNAGTSIEAILDKHLNQRFISHELGRGDEAFPAEALLPFLSERPDIAAISSHTIHFPIPDCPDYTIFPLVFLRHPLDRILSMYNFEAKQEVQGIGAELAKNENIAGYISTRLRDPYECTLRNYQVWMLAHGRAGVEDQQALFEIAKQEIESIPVVGVVEEFSESISQLTKWLLPFFPDLDMKPEHKNRSELVDMNLEKRLDLLKQEIGTELYERLESENSFDIELHRIATKRLLANRSS